jgi:predicted dehydrogenase
MSDSKSKNSLAIDQLSVVVVGTGFIGPVHVEGLRRAGIGVAGIVGSSPERSAQAARELNLPGGYASLDEVLADRSIAAVHLATPNRLHFEQAQAVLASGKHVLCEKPLAMTSQQSSRLVEIARDSGLAAGVAYNIRFYPLCHEAAARAQQESFGDFLHVTGAYVQDWLLYPQDFNWRVLAEDGGELRAVADIGTHWLDLIQFITHQRIVSVCADLRTVHPKRSRPQGGVQTFSNNDKSSESVATEAVPITTEDCGSILLRFENGANGCLWVSQTTAGRKNCLRFEIGGSKSSMAWNSEAPNSLIIGHRDRANEALMRDPALLSSTAQAIASYPGGHHEGFPDTFKQLFRTFYQDIASGAYQTQPRFPTFADGHREILLCEAILQSHRQRQWVDVA